MLALNDNHGIETHLPHPEFVEKAFLKDIPIFDLSMARQVRQIMLMKMYV